MSVLLASCFLMLFGCFFASLKRLDLCFVKSFGPNPFSKSISRLRGPKLQELHFKHHRDPLVDHLVNLRELKPHINRVNRVNLGRLQSSRCTSSHHIRFISHMIIILISHYIRYVIRTYCLTFEPEYVPLSSYVNVSLFFFHMLPMLPAGRDGSPTWTDPSVETTKTRLQG